MNEWDRCVSKDEEVLKKGLMRDYNLVSKDGGLTETLKKYFIYFGITS